MITGAYDRDELFTCLERHRAEGGWTYGLLYDFRYMIGEPTIETLRKTAAAFKPRPGDPPRGPVAMLATNPIVYKQACTYAAMARAHAVIEVFACLQDAQAWLGKTAGE